MTLRVTFREKWKKWRNWNKNMETGTVRISLFSVIFVVYLAFVYFCSANFKPENYVSKYKFMVSWFFHVFWIVFALEFSSRHYYLSHMSSYVHLILLLMRNRIQFVRTYRTLVFALFIGFFIIATVSTEDVKKWKKIYKNFR